MENIIISVFKIGLGLVMILLIGIKAHDILVDKWG